ncbi:MAG: hypothetical protein U0936_27570 [Planctomycetaceae bacterium]
MPFAKLMLKAVYETTLCTGIAYVRMTGHRMVFLTLLGVVTLEDMTEWSTDAINHAFNMHRYTGLDFAIASDQSFAGIRQTIALSIRLLPM